MIQLDKKQPSQIEKPQPMQEDVESLARGNFWLCVRFVPERIQKNDSVR